jgi:hypothetical protein
MGYLKVTLFEDRVRYVVMDEEVGALRFGE